MSSASFMSAATVGRSASVRNIGCVALRAARSIADVAFLALAFAEAALFALLQGALVQCAHLVGGLGRVLAHVLANDAEDRIGVRIVGEILVRPEIDVLGFDWIAGDEAGVGVLFVDLQLV